MLNVSHRCPLIAVPLSFRKYPRELRGSTSEREIETLLFTEMVKLGENPKRQVKVDGGKADIVTNRWCIEVKRKLTNNSLKSALGQVLVYSDFLKKTPVIAGVAGDCDQGLVRRLWDDQGVSFLIKLGHAWVFHVKI